MVYSCTGGLFATLTNSESVPKLGIGCEQRGVSGGCFFGYTGGMNTQGQEVYISVDAETDGPIPGPYSMVSFGAYAACSRTVDGDIAGPFPQSPTNTFYAELQPISERYDPEALAVSGLTREHLLANGEDPAAVMTRFAAWVHAIAARPEVGGVVFAAYPLGFDWSFVYWYLVNFAGTPSPFGHSKHLDIKSYYAARAGKLIGHAVKRRMPRSLMSNHPHTHNPLDDAIEQGELLTNLLRWDGTVADGKG